MAGTDSAGTNSPTANGNHVALDASASRFGMQSKASAVADTAFARDLDSIDRALATGVARRHLAREAHARAAREVEIAEKLLLGALEQQDVRQRHIDMCDRAIAALLDERNEATRPKDAD